MKRCPTCQKTFADSLRFCQADGTLLTEEADDAYKTVIGDSAADAGDDDNLLQIPNDFRALNETDSGFGNATERFSPPFDTSAFQPPPVAFDEPNAAGKDFQFPQMPLNQGSFGQYQNPPEQPLTQAWAPPPVPDANWQSQNIGANTPFQPPMMQAGQNQTLPIISLVCGVASFVLICCYGGFPLGIAALVTGYLGIQGINKDSLNFGGKGMAIAGMILGGISLALSVLLLVGGLLGAIFRN